MPLPGEASGRSGAVVPLMDWLGGQGHGLAAEEFNAIGCQVMDLHFALQGGEQRQVEDDPAAWFYDVTRQRVIFPWFSGIQGPAQARAQSVHRNWFDGLARLGLADRKPLRQAYAEPLQQELRRRILSHLREYLICLPAVRRIYLMGPAMRGDMGRFVQPHVQRTRVKLGCDVDLLIELRPGYEDRIPSDWLLYVERADNSGCPVYHLGDLQLADEGDVFAPRFPAIPFAGHLLQAHVYLPSSCDIARRDAFLREFGAELVLEAESEPFADVEESRLALLLGQHWGLADVVVRPLDAPARGRVHLVDAGNRRLVLKVSVDSGTFDRHRLAEHAHYEAALIQALRSRGFPTPALVAARNGLTAAIGGSEALLFERFDGVVCDTLEYPTEAAARALAGMHCLQAVRPLALETRFTYLDYAAIWLPWLQRSRACPELPPELERACRGMEPPGRRFRAYSELALLDSRGVHVHCHGDVKPRNTVVHADGSVSLFDFDNALFGPRLMDAIDGAFAFALAEQHVDHIDFSRFAQFLKAWCGAAALTRDEHEVLADCIKLSALLQFTRELTMWVQSRQELRRRRALALAGFVADEGWQALVQAVRPLALRDSGGCSSDQVELSGEAAVLA